MAVTWLSARSLRYCFLVLVAIAENLSLRRLALQALITAERENALYHNHNVDSTQIASGWVILLLQQQQMYIKRIWEQG